MLITMIRVLENSLICRVVTNRGFEIIRTLQFCISTFMQFTKHYFPNAINLIYFIPYKVGSKY
jgi:hypothetical protein